MLSVRAGIRNDGEYRAFTAGTGGRRDSHEGSTGPGQFVEPHVILDLSGMGRHGTDGLGGVDGAPSPASNQDITFFSLHQAQTLLHVFQGRFLVDTIVDHVGKIRIGEGVGHRIEDT
jgi:hypothetical protein